MPLFVLLLFLVPCLAWAEPITVQDGVGHYDLAGRVEILRDPDNRLTIQDIVQGKAAFQSLSSDENLSLGYYNGTVWLKTVVRTPPSGSKDAWLLELAFPTLDSVTFYRNQAWGEYTGLETGDHTLFATRPINHRNYVFPLDLASAPAGTPQTYYLRIRSQGSLTLPLALWSSQAFLQYNQQGYGILALYFGAFLAMAIYNLILFFSLRDRVFLIYVAFVTSMAIGLSSQYGLAYQFLWPQSPLIANVAYPSGFALTGMFGALFTRRFLDTPRHVPRSDRFLKILIGLFAFNAVLPFVQYQWGAIFVSLTATVFSPFALALGIWFVRRRHHGARFYLAAWGLLLIFTTTMSLRNLGWLPSNFITLNGMQIGSALEMMLLSFALAHRYNMLQQEKESAQQEALLSKQNMVEALQQNEYLLEQRVTDRTQELEKANAKLQESQKLLREMAHHDALTGLANRLLLDIHLEHAMQSASRQGGTVAVMLLDLDGFKPVNDQYGHGGGDDLLIELALRMQGIVRQSDTVARLGGDEFIILLESVASVEAAMAVADKLIEALCRPVRLSAGPHVQVGVSIGVTLMTERDITREALIARADLAMYEAKAAGGKRACFKAG
ncbi:diguanylate cyclase [Denitratisoma sp. agr-D3]